MCLDAIFNDDQAQMGTCSDQTQLVAVWIARPKEMMEAAMNCITTGEHETYSGEVVRLTANELGRGDTNGQKPSNFQGNSMISYLTYGKFHYNGNNVQAVGGATMLLGESEDEDGVAVDETLGFYPAYSPGHSMGKLNKAVIEESDGDELVLSLERDQYNHWGRGNNPNEPGDGLDKMWKRIRISKNVLKT